MRAGSAQLLHRGEQHESVEDRDTELGLELDSHLYGCCAEQRAGLGIALFEPQSESEVGVTWCTPELRGVNQAVHFRGLGLAMANGLAVAWYPDVDQLALLDYVLDAGDHQSMSATWALGGFTSLGTERLRRSG
jgi:hypothetical protein